METDTLKIKAFGLVAEIVNSQELEVEHIADTTSLMELLIKRYPDLKSTSFSLAMNRKQINGNTLIPSGAELALLPPFSGG
jgi:sulfur-carrier protein